MRNLKKLLALVLALMMTMSLMVTVNAASPKDFSDLDDTSFSEAINVLSALKVVEGYEDGKFQPKADITRAEVCTMIYRIVTGDVAGKQLKIYADYDRFDDVPSNQWYAGAINFCANAEIVKGDGDGTFRPNANITGYEILAMVLRAIGYGQNAEFESSGWQIRTASTAKLQGITANISEGTLGTNSPREMVAEIIFRALQTPTVTYKPYIGYDKNVLVENTEDNRNIHYWQYVEAGNTLPIYDNLMYEKFEIVAKGGLDNDIDNYGRPCRVWVKDDSADKVVTTYAPTAEVTNGVWTDENGDEHPIVTTTTGRAALGDAGKYIPSENDTVALTIPLVPVETYYVEKTECDVAKEVNNDKSLKNVSEWLNGAPVRYTDGSGNVIATTRQLDALHTTTDKIGAQGRTTEIYKVGTMPNGDGIWNIIYIDTLLGVVDNVTPRTYDTNNHTYHPAQMDIVINDNVTVTYYDNDKDFEYEGGELLLWNTYGGKDLKQNDSQDGVEKAYLEIPLATAGATLRSNNLVPHTQADFQLKVANATGTDVVDEQDARGNDIYAIDLVGEASTTSITVKATTGAYGTKTGLVATDNETYPASNVYCAEAERDDSDKNATTGYDGYYSTNQGTYVVSDYSMSMNNSLINKTVNLYRDLHDNIIGMDADGAAAGGIGVILQMETMRAGTGNYYVEAEIFHADDTTETVRLLTYKDGAYNYVHNDQGEWDTFNCKKGHTNCITPNTLIEYEPVTTVGGVTYYGVKECGWKVGNDHAPYVDNTNATGNGDYLVRTGVADTLRETGAAGVVLNDKTPIIIAGTTFDYSVVGGENTGSRVIGNLKGYTGFKTIPSILGVTTDVNFQIVNGTYYIYPRMEGSNVHKDARYSFVSPAQFAVDNSYLVLATVATYQDHATYKVLQNGVETTLNVANANYTDAEGQTTGLNETVERAMAANELIRVTGWDINGYATAIGATANVGACDNTSGALTTLSTVETTRVFAQTDSEGNPVKTATIGADVTVSCGRGVMTLTKDGTTEYLTIADDCQVQIVNVANGFVTSEGVTLAHVAQYRTPRNTTVDGGHGISELVYELNNLGYICNIYIID